MYSTSEATLPSALWSSVHADAPIPWTYLGDMRKRPEAWSENRPSDRWLPRLELRELWAYRELAFASALKTLRVRYEQTIFGGSWAVLQPVLAGRCVQCRIRESCGLPTDGTRTRFKYAAMIVWLYVSSGLTAT